MPRAQTAPEILSFQTRALARWRSRVKVPAVEQVRPRGSPCPVLDSRTLDNSKLGADARLAEELLVDRLGGTDFELPPFPHTTLQTLEILADPAVDSGRVEHSLRADPTMAAEVLRFANSALYAPAKRIDNLRHAVSFLGFRRVHSLALGIASKIAAGQCAPPKLTQELWAHGASCAFLSLFLASEADLDSEAAFLGGLLHDLGKIAVAGELSRIERRIGLHLTHAERVVLLELHHEVLGSELATAWRLPEGIVNVVTFHHASSSSSSLSPLVPIVRAADALCYSLGLGPTSADAGPPAIRDAAALGWSETRAEEVVARAIPAMLRELAKLA